MELPVEGSVMALDKDAFFPGNFHEGSEIGKGLKSNAISNVAGVST